MGILNSKKRVLSKDKETNGSSFSTRAGRLSSVKRPSIPSGMKDKFNSTLILLAACFLVGFGGGMLGSAVNNSNDTMKTNAITGQKFIDSESELISAIASSTGKSVVSVSVQSKVVSQDFFGFSRSSNQESAGTGFIVDSKGIIVTNRHVVPDGSTSVSVTLDDGTVYENVEIIGRTSESSSLDIAFLKIKDLKGKTLTPAKLGDSSKVKVGDRVVAIGNALGQFQNSVTSGIISGYGRDVTAGDESGSTQENLTDLFQTDAAINQGNSGGPLTNINGEVIGINTAVAGSGQNIGFAIPINDLKGLIDSVLSGGKLQQPYLGVRYVSLTNDQAKQYGLKINRGAYVIGTDTQPAVIDGSPAQKAGLKEKDVITKVNNITIDDKTSLSGILGQFKVGNTVSLTVVRDGKTLTIKATLDELPG